MARSKSKRRQKRNKRYRNINDEDLFDMGVKYEGNRYTPLEIEDTRSKEPYLLTKMCRGIASGVTTGVKRTAGSLKRGSQKLAYAVYLPFAIATMTMVSISTAPFRLVSQKLCNSHPT
jgi:hypothetical protein